MMYLYAVRFRFRCQTFLAPPSVWVKSIHPDIDILTAMIE